MITIAIPTHNRLALLKRAVASCLSQQSAALEILIADNASTDGTAEWCRAQTDPRIRVLRHQQNVGMYPNWNSCLAAARGEFFVILSDDDWLEDQAAAAFSAAFADHPGCFAAISEFIYHDTLLDDTSVSSHPPGVISGAQLIRDFLGGRKIFPCGVALRTELLRAIGGYDLRDGLCADFGALLSLSCARHAVCNIGRPLAHYWAASGNACLRGTDMVEAIHVCFKRHGEGLPRTREWQYVRAAMRRYERRAAVWSIWRMALAGASRREIFASCSRIAKPAEGDIVKQCLLAGLCAAVLLPRVVLRQLKRLQLRIRKQAEKEPSTLAGRGKVSAADSRTPASENDLSGLGEAYPPNNPSGSSGAAALPVIGQRNSPV